MASPGRRSSAGQSAGLITRRSVVRAHPPLLQEGTRFRRAGAAPAAIVLSANFTGSSQPAGKVEGDADSQPARGESLRRLPRRDRARRRSSRDTGRGRGLGRRLGPVGAERSRNGAPSASRLTIARVSVAERCWRCSATMEWRHGTWQCPRCRFKLGCCEGEPQTACEQPAQPAFGSSAFPGSPHGDEPCLTPSERE
jgi:hypothetical protein